MDPTVPISSGRPPDSGDRLLAGRYLLRGLLGRGGMAEVYRAYDNRLGRDVAVKLFGADSGVPQQDAREQGEIRLLAALNHPGLVTVLDAGSEPGERGRRFLVMEYVDGASLGDRLRGGPLTPDQTAEIGAQVSAALSYVHSRGVVHRDVKPANILLTDPPAGHPGTVAAKLTDFGVARWLDDTRITTVGMTIGTANYLSPEQATGAEVGPPTDVYALGLVLLECLTGRPAYPGHGVAAAGARLHRPPDIPAELGPDWTSLLTGMTALQPNDRPTADEAGAALRRLIGTATATAPLATAVLGPILPPTRHLTVPAVHALPGRKRRWVLVAAAVAVVGVLAVILALANSGHGRLPVARSSTTTRASHSAPAPSPTSTPITTLAQAITHFRAVVAQLVNTGNLGLADGTDLDNRLDAISNSLSSPGGQGPDGNGPGGKGGPNGDVSHKVSDLAQHLTDLANSGQLSAAGLSQLEAALTILERLLPATTQD